MPWMTKRLRGDRVWVRVTPSGQLAAAGDGRVEVVYQKGGKTYRASSRNLTDDPERLTLSEEEMQAAAQSLAARSRRSADAAGPDAEPGARAEAPSGARAEAHSATKAHPSPRARSRPAGEPIVVYTDGACTGNPGPAGIGVVLLDGKGRRELSEYLGQGTNNIAELTAIVRALEEAPRDRTVIVHSDSTYALGLLGKGWKAKANQDLVERMRALAREFADLRLVKVPAHSGVPENERADALARNAISTRASGPVRR